MSKTSKTVFVAGHKWGKDFVLIQTKATNSGRVYISYHELDFAALNISSTGLLAKCVQDSSPPTDTSESHNFLSAIKYIAPGNATFRRILSAEPRTLGLIDISDLFTISDAHFKKMGLRSSPASAEKFRSVISRCQSLLRENLSLLQNYLNQR